MAGKGDKQRPVDSERYRSNYDNISFGDNCPDCDNRGWYYISTDGEQEQCQWCWENPNSKFNRKNAHNTNRPV